MLDPAGYLLYLAAILLPGFGIGELTGVWKEGRGFTEALGYMVGIGFAAGTIFLAIGTSGAQVGGVRLLGVSAYDFYALAAIGALCLAISWSWKRKISLPRPGGIDLAVVLLMLAQVGMLALFFAKYPVFPEYDSVDFGSHALVVQNLIAGSFVPPGGGLFYYAVHYQLALGAALTGGPALVAIQRIAGVLSILGTPLIFLAASRVLANRGAGLIAAILYALTASIWIVGPFDTGLYPNFFGILASLFVLALAADFFRDGMDAGLIVIMAMATVLLYLAHYSDISVIPMIVAAPLVLLLKKRFCRASLIPALFIVAPAAAAAAVLPGLVGSLFSFVACVRCGQVVGGTFLSNALSGFPVLAGMASETFYDLGFVAALALAGLFIARTIKEKDGVKAMPVIWFFSIILVAPFNEGAWRLAYVGLVPLTLMAAGGLASLLPQDSSQAPKTHRDEQLAKQRRFLVSVLLIILLVESRGLLFVADASVVAQPDAAAQQDVYQAIMWFGNNTHGSLLSVSDFRFLYTEQLIGRNSTYQFESTPAQALALAHMNGTDYIAVTQIVPFDIGIPTNSSLLPWSNFPASSDANLTLVYTNDDVRIYQIANSTSGR